MDTMLCSNNFMKVRTYQQYKYNFYNIIYNGQLNQKLNFATIPTLYDSLRINLYYSCMYNKKIGYMHKIKYNAKHETLTGLCLM